jgi:hypothetical protein
MRVQIGNKYNLFATTLDVTAKTLTITGLIGCDIEPADIQSIYSTTATASFVVGKNVISTTYSLVAGLPVWVVLFGAIPAGVANGDALVILINIPDTYALYSLNAYSASKV